MSDNLNDLPKFPGEEYEERLRRHKDPPDRLIDQLRHAWPVHLIFGGLLGLWGIAVVVLALSTPGWPVFFAVLMLPAAVVVRVAGWWRDR